MATHTTAPHRIQATTTLTQHLHFAHPSTATPTPGFIYYLPARPPTQLTTSHPPITPGILNHPVLILSLDPLTPTDQILIITSPHSLPLTQYAPHSPRLHLPIFPTDPHPDTGALAYLDTDCGLPKTSHVKLDQRHTAPVEGKEFQGGGKDVRAGQEQQLADSEPAGRFHEMGEERRTWEGFSGAAHPPPRKEWVRYQVEELFFPFVLCEVRAGVTSSIDWRRGSLIFRYGAERVGMMATAAATATPGHVVTKLIRKPCSAEASSCDGQSKWWEWKEEAVGVVLNSLGVGDAGT
ncbi:MAG: hypothetical protein LQ343_001527 [Gyalolechia ehrenbergii]|nr:MAG: hypothetical protein LQ343_001527 [Gyalolechia ehrenbergii]